MTVLDRALDEPAVPNALTALGKPLRDAHFLLASTYHNLNHGAYGTYPAAVGAVREHHLREHEARPDLYKQLAHPALLTRARAALLPLLNPEDGADVVRLDELVLVNNATSGVHLVLHNLATTGGWTGDDVVFYFEDFVYAACRNILHALADAGRLRAVGLHVTLPADSTGAALSAKLEAAVADATRQGLRPRAALFDTVASWPGVRLPWEDLAGACRRLDLLSVVDGAHCIGQLDVRHLGMAAAQPDFFVSNCHKWLFVPRGCAVLYVPTRNQHHIVDSIPTTHSYRRPGERGDAYFVDLLVDGATLDYSPWMCIPAALSFRARVCGGEDAIRRYSVDLARSGSARVAAVLGTEVLDGGPGSTLRDCCLAMVRLPVPLGDEVGAVPRARVGKLLAWLMRVFAAEYDTYIRIDVFQGQLWTRLSAQVYLDLDDFEWCAQTLLALCKRINQGEWKEGVEKDKTE